jgi:hypothetical protein
MHHLEAKKILRIFGLLTLVVSMAIFISACKGKEKTEAPSVEKAAVQPEEITMDTVSAVLGKAEAEKSGIFDLAKTDHELQVVYHFYTLEMKDIDDDIGVEMGPKIKDLYKKFKIIDRVVFAVQVSHPDTLSEWKPYCFFVMTRKVIRETNWTDLLDTDFFKVVQELKYVE